MKFLTQEQRDKAIERLKKAPDEVILSAMVEMRRIEHFEQGVLANITALVEPLKQVPPAVVVPTPEPFPFPGTVTQSDVDTSKTPPGSIIPVDKNQKRLNKSPGAATTTKIGVKNVDLIIEYLSKNDLDCKKLAKTGPCNEANLKLLWSRGKIKFDGSYYYL